MKNLLFVISMYHRDAKCALEITRWMLELGTKCDDRALVVTTKSASGMPEVAQVIYNLQQIFQGGVEHYPLVVEDERGPWFSNNFMFRSVAQYVEHKIKDIDGFYFFEPDCTPMTPDWWEKIKAEYDACGMPFMGDVRGVTHELNSPFHMNGSGIYPQNVAKYSVKALRAEAQPWDAFAREEIVPHAYRTRLISTLFNTINYREIDGKIVTRIGLNGKQDAGPDVGIDPQAVVIHGCKDGSLLEILRRRRAALHRPAIAPSTKTGRPLRELAAPQVRTGILVKAAKRKSALKHVNLTEEEVEQAKGLVTALELFCLNEARTRDIRGLIKQSKLLATA